MVSHKVLIEENIRLHDQVAGIYNNRHKEIYNPTEQKRLQIQLNQAFGMVTSSNPRLLDFGCGTGNLTEKLLPFGREVWAADVSPRMLETIEQKFPKYVEKEKLHCFLLSGDFPLPFPDRHFSFIATYSVLHHVPDYLEAVRELCRLLDDGGVLYIDHEVNANYWHPPIFLRIYRILIEPGYFLNRIITRTKNLFGVSENVPDKEDEIFEEGDIHVHPDDHIEWDAIAAIAAENNLKKIPTDNYLLCRETSHFPVRHHIFRPFVDDMGIYIGRKELP